MKHYTSYMDRQEISPDRHETLMNLSARRKPSPRAPWLRYGALAACAALALGVGGWRLSQGFRADGDLCRAVQPPSAEEQDAAPGIQDPNSFVVAAPEDSGKLAYPAVPDIDYQDVSHASEAEPSRAFAPGSFNTVLTKEDIQSIFWGPEGRPEADYPKLEQGDLPWALFWEGYTLNGFAWYDGQGQFTELTIYGAKDAASFTLELRLGALPFTCEVDSGRTASDVMGVSVTGWSRAYDRDGDGATDYICGSEFMTENGIGVRFENVNADMRSEYGGNRNTEKGGTEEFNALFVRQALTSGLYLDHLMTNSSIPPWRDETYRTLEQARQEADYAPYLPTAVPQGMENAEFFGRLSYQQDVSNSLFVRWVQAGGSVEVDVSFPEAEGAFPYSTVDAAVPESYDYRLYEDPWWETIPEEYRASFSDAVFRAEDMSLEVVEARADHLDTGEPYFHFSILYPSGVAAHYYASGITAQQLWAVAEPTLP